MQPSRLAVLLVVLVGVAAPTAAVAGPQVPRPVEILPAPDDAADGVSITPALLVLDDDTPMSELAVVNGTDAPAGLELAVREVTRLEGDTDPAVGGALGAEAPLVLAERSIRLDPGEQARFTPARRTMDEPAPLLAVTAGPSGTPADEHATAFVVLDDGSQRDVEVTLALSRHAGRGSTAELRIGAVDVPAAVDMRVRAVSWTGRTVLDTTQTGLVVPAGASREVVIGLPRLTLPGPVTVEAVAAHRGEEPDEASARVWQADLVVVVLVALAVVLVVRARRRRRRGADRGGDRGIMWS